MKQAKIVALVKHDKSLIVLERSGKPVQYTVRRSERVGLYICVKEGLFLAGIAFPADMSADNKLDFVGELVAVAWAADRMRRLKQTAAEYADQQTMMEAT